MNAIDNRQHPIHTLKSIALSAGALVREGFFAHKSVSHKGVVDLVTQYDVATEQHILAALTEHFSEYTLVGEESHLGNFSQTHERAIYIDPIDGTTNFVHGVPHCAVSIGVYAHGRATMAVVYNPILDELFWAVAGQGAYLTQGALSSNTSSENTSIENTSTQALHVSTQTELQQSLIATGFPYTKVTQGEDYAWVMHAMALVLPHTRDVRRLGSAALDLCYVARGMFDAYYEIGLKPWDYAAGALIAQEAGAILTDVRGAAISFEDNTVMAAPAAIHAALLALLKP